VTLLVIGRHYRLLSSKKRLFYINISKPTPKPKQNQNLIKINTIDIKTISKSIPKLPKLYQDQYQDHQNHIKTNTKTTKPISKPILQYQNDIEANTSKPKVLDLVHA
jgi:hypothetical protein